jgi:hypothetical protein
LAHGDIHRPNRVDPLGALHAVPERGALMGNRGCLHGADGRILRGWQGRRWIACRLAFRGRRRALMQPGRYTELFFLDEATACAAGHRPCGECRQEDWQTFRALWTQVHGGRGDAEGIDRALHTARLDGLARRLPPTRWPDLPPGAMVLARGGPALVTPQGLWRWSFAGYAPLAAPPEAQLITPAPLIPLLAAGLRLQTACLAAAVDAHRTGAVPVLGPQVR